MDQNQLYGAEHGQRGAAEVPHMGTFPARAWTQNRGTDPQGTTAAEHFRTRSEYSCNFP